MSSGADSPAVPDPPPSTYALVAHTVVRLALGDLEWGSHHLANQAHLDDVYAAGRALSVEPGMFGEHDLDAAAADFVGSWHRGAARLVDVVEELSDQVREAGLEFAVQDQNLALRLTPTGLP